MHFILAYILVPMFGAIVVMSLWSVFAVSKPMMMYGLSFITWGVIFCYRLVTWREQARKVLGLVFPGVKSLLIYASVTAFSAIALGVIINWLAFELHWTLQDPFATGAFSHQLWLKIIAVTIAPVLEELVFRGYLQGSLYRYFAPGQVILITAFGFTALHGLYYGNLPALIYVLTLGLLLGWIRHRTGSVFPGMLGHVLNNLMGILLR
jgi:membrane protease YdiL (CAAX protease family)